MKVKALKPCFYYHGRNKGDIFDAQDRFAHLMIRMGAVEAVSGEAEDAPKRTYKRKDMQAEGGAK